MEVSKKSANVTFNLEIIKKEGEEYSMRLINLYNNYSYIPAFESKIGESIVSVARKSGFTVHNIFDLHSPFVSFGNHQVKFILDQNNGTYAQSTKKQINMNSVVSELKSLKESSKSQINELENDINKKVKEFNDKNLANQEKVFEVKRKIEKLNTVDKDETKTKEKNAEKEKSAATPQFTELDLRYEHIKGVIKYCKGESCTQTGSIWGSNPYTCDDGGMHCLAARHSGIVGSEGGFYELKLIGTHDTYLSSTNSGITSLSYSTYSGYSIHAVYDESLIEGKSKSYCGQV